MDSHLYYDSPLGRLFLSGNDEALTELRFDDGGERQPQEEAGAIPAPIASTVKWLDLYFSGRCPAWRPPIRPAGSAFSRAVWEIMQRRSPCCRTGGRRCLRKKSHSSDCSVPQSGGEEREPHRLFRRRNCTEGETASAGKENDRIRTKTAGHNALKALCPAASVIISTFG